MNDSVSWSVVMTKPRREDYAAARLAEQDKSTKVAEVDVVADEAPAARRRKQ